MSVNDLKQGQQYNGIIVSSSWDSSEPVNYKVSKPIQIQISPFVRGSIPFNQIVDIDYLTKHGVQGKSFKIGKKVSVKYMQNG